MLYREQDILDWARDRGLLEVKNRTKQALKTATEVAELIEHSINGTDITDDIGDIYVTIVIQAYLNARTMQRCLTEQFEIPEDYFKGGDSTELLVELHLATSLMASETLDSAYDEYSSISEHIRSIYMIINEICDQKDLSFKACVDLAYNEIKGRTGKLVNGVFVKDEKH